MTAEAHKLSEFLCSRLKGQDAAITVLAEKIATWDREKPLVLMLAGPPGVGKVSNQMRTLFENGCFHRCLCNLDRVWNVACSLLSAERARQERRKRHRDSERRMCRRSSRDRRRLVGRRRAAESSFVESDRVRAVRDRGVAHNARWRVGDLSRRRWIAVQGCNTRRLVELCVYLNEC